LRQSRPDVAFELQTALGMTMFEVDRAQGKRTFRRKKADFLSACNARFRATCGTSKSASNFALLVRGVSTADRGDRRNLVRRVDRQARSERRMQGPFASAHGAFNRLWSRKGRDAADPVLNGAPAPAGRAYAASATNRDSVSSVDRAVPRSTAERTQRVAHLQHLYTAFIDEKIRAAGGPASLRMDRPDDPAEAAEFVRFCAANAADASTRGGGPPGSTANGYPSSLAAMAALREAVESLESGRVAMAKLTRQAALRRHHSFGDVFDLESSYRTETVQATYTTVQRRKSFPSFTSKK